MGVLIFARDTASELENVPNTLSSWSSCMSQSYCKWPVIAGIIIGSLIALSIVWCLVRCLCCGMSCCCDCMSCCTSCCPGGGRGHKHQKLDQGNQYQPAPYQGYQPAQAPPRYEPPRYAQFDISRGGKVSDDSLPAMPVWDSASQRKVFDERQDDDMELGNFDAAAAQNVSMLAKPTSSPTHGYAEADSNPIYSYQDWGREGGGDLGVSYPYGHPIGTYGGAYAQSPPPNNPSPGGYGGGQNPYTAFSPTGVNTTYDQPAYRQGSLVPQYPAQSQSQPLVAVRKPVQGSWREI